MDLKDKKILYELDKNAQSNVSSVAKKVGLSKQVTSYRIKKLKEKGIIKNFLAIIDLAKLGYTVYKVYFRFQKLDDKKEKEMIKYFTAHKNVTWIVFCEGRWDMIVCFIAKSVVSFMQILTEIVNKFYEYIREKQVCVMYGVHHYHRNYLLNKKELTTIPPFFGGEPKIIELTGNEKKIVALLCKDARMSHVEIAKKINLSNDIVTARIKDLKKKGILQGANLFLDHNKLHFPYYKVLLWSEKILENRKKEFLTYLNLNPNVILIIESLGNWDIELDIEIENSEKLRNLIKDLINNFGDVIDDYEVLHIYDEHKFTYFPLEQEN